MIKFEGEITGASCPPNKAEAARSLTIWFEEANESMDFTVNLDEFKKSELKVGDKVTVQINKKFDIDHFAQTLFNKA